MGLYINETPAGPMPVHNKAAWLLATVPGTQQLPRAPFNWVPNLVCVVDNDSFEAAAYCDSATEFDRFNDPRDPRRKWWLVVPGVKGLAR